MKPTKVPCKSMFSNGTEYEFFLERQCFKCKRFRNWHCKILNEIEEARFLGEERIPFDDLMEWDGGFGGKTCKSFTTEPIIRKPKTIKPISGQEKMWGE